MSSINNTSKTQVRKKPINYKGFVTFRISEDVSESLKDITKKLCRSKAFIAEKAVAYYINNIIENGYTETHSFEDVKPLSAAHKQIKV